MTDYVELELKLQKFLQKLKKYKKVYFDLINLDDRNEKLINQEKRMRENLTIEYGELHPYIEKISGYCSVIWGGKKVDVFLAALDPRLDRDNFIKSTGFDFSIQCLYKAIGGCRYERSIEETEDEIIIEKGAIFRGLQVIRKILKKAKKIIRIQDRYLNADIFDFIEELNKNINIAILVQKESYSAKTALKKIYASYRNIENNVEIRECEQNKFHSRKILIDDNEGYNPDFTLQHIGINESYLHKIKDVKTSKKEFDKLWQTATPLSIK